VHSELFFCYVLIGRPWALAPEICCSASVACPDTSSKTLAPHVQWLLACLQGTHNVANLQKIMTRIGGVCLVTIGIWCVIEMAVQFGHYGHTCKLGEGASAHVPTLFDLNMRACITASICTAIVHPVCAQQPATALPLPCESTCQQLLGSDIMP
jgi:hypothetical protein